MQTVMLMRIISMLIFPPSTSINMSGNLSFLPQYLRVSSRALSQEESKPYATLHTYNTLYYHIHTQLRSIDTHLQSCIFQS